MSRQLDDLWLAWLDGPDGRYSYWVIHDGIERVYGPAATAVWRSEEKRRRRWQRLYPLLCVVALVVILACFTVPS